MPQTARMISGGAALSSVRHGCQRLSPSFGVRLAAFTLGLLVVMGAASLARAQEVLLSVAVSLKDATEELGREFQRTHPGVSLQYNFGASGDLQKQIEAGAPVDLFISAGQKQIDALEKPRLLQPGSRRIFARNVLTLIVPADSRLDLRGPADLLRPQVQRVVIGNPKTVPAGQYAEESLRSLGLWEALRPKLVLAENVRQALEYVARGEVDAGFVYATDAGTRAGRIKEAGRPPQESYAPVIYPGAILAASRHPALAQAFLDLLLSPPGQQVFARWGFQPPQGSSR
jgi:molybdate transport system substrate-binding protein